MSGVDRATELITAHCTQGGVLGNASRRSGLAQALLDAGLLKTDAEQKLLEDWAQSQVEGWDVLTPADRAVLAAADEWVLHMDLADTEDSHTPDGLCADIALVHLDEAVRARREAQS